jgi:hypothetical protein
LLPACLVDPLIIRMLAKTPRWPCEGLRLHRVFGHRAGRRN